MEEPDTPPGAEGPQAWRTSIRKFRTIQSSVSSFQRSVRTPSSSFLNGKKTPSLPLWIPGMFPDTGPPRPTQVSAVINPHRRKLPPIPNDGRKRGVKERGRKEGKQGLRRMRRVMKGDKKRGGKRERMRELGSKPLGNEKPE